MALPLVVIALPANDPRDHREQAFRQHIACLFERDAWVWRLMHVLTFGGFIGLAVFQLVPLRCGPWYGRKRLMLVRATSMSGLIFAPCSASTRQRPSCMHQPATTRTTNHITEALSSLQSAPRRACLKQGAVWLLGSTALAWPAFGQIVNLNEAINKAGRQRMLSQRMAKAWLALGQGLDARRAERVLFDSMALFDRQLVELKAYAPTPEIKATYNALEPVWSDYKSALVGASPDRNAAAPLLTLDTKVLKLAHLGTVQLEQYSGKAVGKLVNVAGRERMLSQRTAKFYLSKAWGTASPEQIREMDTARHEFAQALGMLARAPESTPTIRQALDLAQQQWVFFDNALARATESSNAMQHANEVFASSENILQVMDKVTALYSKLA